LGSDLKVKSRRFTTRTIKEAALLFIKLGFFSGENSFLTVCIAMRGIKNTIRTFIAKVFGYRCDN
jgi:hypothetical protein